MHISCMCFITELIETEPYVFYYCYILSLSRTESYVSGDFLFGTFRCCPCVLFETRIYVSGTVTLLTMFRAGANVHLILSIKPVLVHGVYMS